MNQEKIDKILKLVLQLEKEAPTQNIKRLAKSIFIELSKHRFSTSNNSYQNEKTT